MSSPALSGLLALHPTLVPATEIALRDRRGHLPTGVTALDEALGGGWPRGALSELVGSRSSGRTALLLAALESALRREEAAALVDAEGMFDPWAARRAGLALDRLLWIRRAEAPLAAAEVLVAAGGFGLVALDWGEPSPRAPLSAWARLKQTAERQGTALLVVASRRSPDARGAVALRVERRRVRFAAADGGRGDGGEGRARAAGVPPLLTGLEARLILDRAPGARGPAPPSGVRFVHDLGAPAWTPPGRGPGPGA